MLILEGTDNVGKTTMAQRLWEASWFQKHGYEIQHLSKLPTGHDRLMDYVERMNQKGIFDRFWLSGEAYAEARQDPGDSPDYFHPEQLRYIEAHARLLGSFCVVIAIDPEQWIRVRQLQEQKDEELEMYGDSIMQRANNWFWHRGLMSEHCDYMIRLSKDKLFPTDEDMDRAASAYIKRQEDLSEILNG